MEEGASATKLHFGDRELEVSKQFTTGMPKCQNVEMRKTPFGASFGYRELEVSKHFTTGMPKCRNAEMRKTPFGAGFGYRKLECRNTSPQECRNVKNTFWCRFQILGIGGVKDTHDRIPETRNAKCMFRIGPWS
jgi:hypothetical protein